MNSIVEKLRSYGEGCTCAAHSSNECCCDAVWGDNYTSEAADLIEQQAERIKELERKCDYWRDHYKDLRQRIADAPVVAWLGYKPLHDGTYRFIFAETHQELRGVDATKPLISREDLL